MELDSGADVNVMDEHHFHKLLRGTSEHIVLEKSKLKIHKCTFVNTLQNRLKVSVVFRATVRNETRGTETTFVVLEGKINSPPLLSKKTLFDLGMLEIRPDGSLSQFHSEYTSSI
jgi:hypothetical protein